MHEAYLKLVDQDRVSWQSRAHFHAVASQAMRRLLVDHARRRATAKRGGGGERMPLNRVADGLAQQTGPAGHPEDLVALADRAV